MLHLLSILQKKKKKKMKVAIIYLNFDRYQSFLFYVFKW